MVKEFLMPGSLEEFVGYVDERLGEEKGASCAVTLTVDVEKRPDEILGFWEVICVRVAREGPTRSDGRNVFKVFRDFPVEIDVSENGLASARHRLLRKLKNQHLGQLAHVPLGQPSEIRREKEVHSVPPDGAGKMALQCGSELDHVGQQHLRMFGRFSHSQ